MKYQPEYETMVYRWLNNLNWFKVSITVPDSDNPNYLTLYERSLGLTVPLNLSVL